MLLLENLGPAPKVETPIGWKPAVEFNGTEGEATTQGYLPEEKPDFNKFLEEAGFDSAIYEIVDTPRTSRWQVARPFPLDPQWLTAYRFKFRIRADTPTSLPLLYAEAKKTKVSSPKLTNTGKVLVIATADYQVGKVASRGNTQDLIARLMQSFDKIASHLKKNKYDRIYVLDAGDIIENFGNAANLAQLQSSDLSLMDQVDLAATIQWDLLKLVSKHAPVTYASVGSNHCQWRVSKQTVGKPVDDWGIFIVKQLRKLSTEVGLGVEFLIPSDYDESLAFDAFGDKFHIVGLFHGHQANRPDGVPAWLDKQVAGLQPLQNFTVAVSGHFHHTRIQQLGQAHNGGSRWWVQASTSDNSSDWYRLRSGQDSSTGVTAFELEQGKLFSGQVITF
jgi:hypothetical protein